VRRDTTGTLIVTVLGHLVLPLGHFALHQYAPRRWIGFLCHVVVLHQTHYRSFLLGHVLNHQNRLDQVHEGLVGLQKEGYELVVVGVELGHVILPLYRRTAVPLLRRYPLVEFVHRDPCDQASLMVRSMIALFAFD
jgi:hypothetical protein